MQQSFRSQNVLLITVSLVIVFACAISGFALFEPLLASQGGDAFCSVNDPVYLAFKNNLDDFKAFFPAVSSPYGLTSKLFYASGKEQYSVHADYFSDASAKAPLLYVPILEAYSTLAGGTEGYLYAPTLTDYWKTNYKLTSLGNNFYCYGH